MFPPSWGRRASIMLPESWQGFRRCAAAAFAVAFAACPPAAAAQTETLSDWTIGKQTIAVRQSLPVDVRPEFHVSNTVPRRYLVRLDNPAMATARIDGFGRLTLRGRRRGVTSTTVSVTDNQGERVSASFVLKVTGPALVPLFPSAADPVREGLVRIVNHGAEAGEVTITATDDYGMTARPVRLALEGGAVAGFDSADLEQGNPDKGLTGGTGPGQGDWRLVLESGLDFEVLSYLRTGDGFLTPMHDVIRPVDGVYRVSMFNPAGNVDQKSLLRFVNLTHRSDAAAWVRATDDSGTKGARVVVVEVAPGESRTVSATQLETSAGVIGELGDGEGKWRMDLVIEPPLVAMNLLESPSGQLTNLSTVPPVPPDDADAVYSIRYFPAAGDAHGRQGVVRVINRSRVAGNVSIRPIDDAGNEYETLFLSVAAGAAVELDSDDIELGNAGKGLRGSAGPGEGDWRLRFFSGLDFEVLAFVRAPDGLLTSMHEVVPKILNEFRVPTFNPGGGDGQMGMLRLVNLARSEARVTVTGTGDAAGMPETVVTLTIPPRMVHTLTAADLDAGREAASGESGDGTGTWRLRAMSDVPIVAMNLLSSPTGHLANLSTAPDRSGL